MNDNNENKSGIEEDKKTDTKTPERLQEISRRGLNTLTHGRWDNVRNAPIVGKAAQKAEKKVADKLGNTKLGKKIAGPGNHTRPNLGVPTKENNENAEAPSQEKSKKGDVGSRNLQSSLKNKARNLLHRRKKGSDSGENEESKEGENSEAKEETNDTSSDDGEEGLTPQEKIRQLKIKLYIRLALIGLAMFSIFFIVMTIASALTGGGVFKVAPIASYQDYNSDDFQSVTPEDSEVHKDEMSFYEKMSEINEQYGDDINVNYVLAILMDVYYEYSPDYSYEDEELTDKLTESGGIDYQKMTDNAEKFAKLIKEFNSTDYTTYGEIYNKLKESEEFKEYYKDALKNKESDEILENIFRLAEELDTDDEETVLTGETEVTVSESESSTSVKKMTIIDYIADSLYASNISYQDAEKVKAYTIAISTNIIAKNKTLTIDANNASMIGTLCSVTEGCSYNASGNLVEGPGERNAGDKSSQNNFFHEGKYYYKAPLSDEAIVALTNNINSVFGNVLIKSDKTYPQVNSAIVGTGSGDYKTILKKACEECTIKNIGENSYILDASYGDKKVETPVHFYDQNDYGSYKFCGFSTASIQKAGCGVTSMAMVVSTYENNNKYDPVWANDLALKRGHCGKDGTKYAHFTSVAKDMGYKTTVYSKNQSNKWKISKTAYNNILKHLSKGHLIIINVQKGHFTKSGHYMVLSGIDPTTKKVYVNDPNNKNNSKAPRKTGNGWYSFNDIIAPETKAFIIIEKKG